MPDSEFAFDVAAIKPGNPLQDMVHFIANNHGRWEVEGIGLSSLIEDAYGVASYQVEGIPKDLRAQRFDIQAKTLTGPGGGPVPTYDGVGDAKRVQALLADRFGLKLSCRVGEHKTAVLYRDPKHAAPAPSTADPKTHGWRQGHGALTGRISFPQVAGVSAFFLQEKVEDDTGLKDYYDIDMHWTPAGETSDDPDSKTFEQALYETFGVRVKHEMRPIAILVVEQAHAPQLD